MSGMQQTASVGTEVVPHRILLVGSSPGGLLADLLVRRSNRWPGRHGVAAGGEAVGIRHCCCTHSVHSHPAARIRLAVDTLPAAGPGCNRRSQT